jgi:hypothetical protein
MTQTIAISRMAVARASITMVVNRGIGLSFPVVKVKPSHEDPTKKG